MVDFAQLFQLSPGLLATLDVRGRFVDLSPAWTDALGYTLDELRAVPLAELVEPEDRKLAARETARGFTGPGTVGFESRCRHKDGGTRWLAWSARVDPSGQVLICNVQDVTGHRDAIAEREQALELSARAEAEARELADDLHHRIEAQRDAIHSMSTPIIQVWDDIVTMPVVGLVDSVRAADMKNALLETVARTGAKFAIVDLTGVDTVDTATADHLLKVMRAVGLLGARCIMTGIQPTVAQIIVALGLDMQSVVTLRSLREGLRYCMRKMGYHVTRPLAEAPAPTPTPGE